MRGPGRFELVLVGALAASVLSAAPTATQASAAAPKSESNFVSFPAFMQHLRDSTFAGTASGTSSAQNAEQFAQSKDYLESLYRGVDVRATFVTDGAYFDCVTEMTQPTVTALDIKHIASPPPILPAMADAADSTLWKTAGLNQDGQLISCPTGTVPMRRVTLSEVLSFHSLRDFLSKNGGDIPEGDIPGYRHAIGFDNVSNDGGGMDLSVWNPSVVSTTDDHSLGAPVSPCCSTIGKVNDSFTQYYLLYKGNWFLYNDGHEIGYIPKSVYRGGALSKGSTLIEYGGEVYGGATNVNWPPMGSGKFAKAGALKAAYQSSIEYFVGTKAFFPKLTTEVTGGGTTPSSCYSLAYTPAKGTTGPSFYYGGPGGKQGTC
jgi:hypothetical protein